MKHKTARSPFLAASLAALLAAACSSADQNPAQTAPEQTRASAETTEASSTEPAPAAPLAEIADIADIAEANEAAGTTPAAEPTMPDSSSADPTPPAQPTNPVTATEPTEPVLEVATLGAGCFWCIEAVLEQVDGVESVVSGYMGGETPNPTYKDICTGTTGHAEVVQVTFDPTVLPYKDLLDWFWRSHDPTTLNRQGNDRGTQYRSAIFTHSPAQRAIANISKTDVQPTFDDPIVTQIADADTFYKAEGYHQGYYFDNQNQGYCRAIIAPKLKKLGLKY